MSEEIKVILSADASEMAAELQKAENELRRFQAELKKATDVTTIQTLQTSITQLKSKIEVLGASQQKFARSSNTAAYALNDLSRIAQDAPYGFIGIQNNINPLLESFQRLRSESKLTGNSLGKELVGALKGPAGLGLAVGVVSAAITFATVGFSRWVASSKAAKSSSDDFGASTRALATDIKYLGTDLDTLKGQLDLIKQYQRLEFEIKFGKGLSTDIKLAQNAVTGLGYEQAAANIEFQTATKYYNEASQALFTFSQTQQGALEEGNSFIDTINKLGITTDATTADLSGLSDEQKRYAQNVLDARKKLNELQNTFRGYNDKIALAKLNVAALTEEQKRQAAEDARQAAEKKKQIETVLSLLAKLKEDIRDQKALAITFNTSTLKEQAALVKNTITKLITDFNLDPNNEVIIKLKADLFSLNAQIGNEQFQRNLKPLELDVEPKLKGEKFQQKLVDSGSAKQAEEYLTKQEKIAQQRLQDVRDFAVTLAQDTFAQVGTILGEGLFAAISGNQNGLVQAFKGLFDIFGNALIELGKKAIAFGELMEVLKKSIKLGSGFGGIAAGIGLIALGILIKSASAAIAGNSFAVGTRNAPGGMSLVGERGPELLNIPRGAQVVPAAQTAAMMGGMQSVEVFGMLRGQDIYFSNKKYGQTYNRQT